MMHDEKAALFIGYVTRKTKRKSLLVWLGQEPDSDVFIKKPMAEWFW